MSTFIHESGYVHGRINGGPRNPCGTPVSPCRRAVVIDPEDREQVERLLATYHDWKWARERSEASINDMQAALREFANHAESEPEPLPDGLVLSKDGDLLNWRGENYVRQKVSPPTPPKPDEPTGLGAVVEDAMGRRWVRVLHGPAHPGLIPSEGPWKIERFTVRELWDGIDVARVLSEGVTE